MTQVVLHNHNYTALNAYEFQQLVDLAAGGGGGKGMRFVYHEDELSEKFDSAQNEARGAVGDDHMYVEKVMENVRHI